MTTNRDKINAMTNEELVKTLELECSCNCCIYKNESAYFCSENSLCIKGIIKWLESEVEEWF